MSNTSDDPIEKFCQAVKAEKAIRDVIADITAKLNRSNLSAQEGEKHAENLLNAYKALQYEKVYERLKELAKLAEEKKKEEKRGREAEEKRGREAS